MDEYVCNRVSIYNVFPALSILVVRCIHIHIPHLSPYHPSIIALFSCRPSPSPHVHSPMLHSHLLTRPNPSPLSSTRTPFPSLPQLSPLMLIHNSTPYHVSSSTPQPSCATPQPSPKFTSPHTSAHICPPIHISLPVFSYVSTSPPTYLSPDLSSYHHHTTPVHDYHALFSIPHPSPEVVFTCPVFLFQVPFPSSVNTPYSYLTMAG
jgi:hypothetical protein